MALSITKKQRDALYDQILDRLSGISDIWLAVGMENYDAAQRLGRDYSDDLRLVTDDLGWGEGRSGSIELTAPPDVLRRVFGRLHDAAASHTASQERDWAEARDMQERNRVVTEACRSVLADLDAIGNDSR
jgi:hypothetical protein